MVSACHRLSLLSLSVAIWGHGTMKSTRDVCAWFAFSSCIFLSYGHAMPAIYLCSYPNGHLRVGNRSYREWRFPHQALWLKERILSSDPSLQTSITNSWIDRKDRNWYNLHQKGFCVHGIVHIEAGNSYEGPLTVWSNEAHYLHKFYNQPLDAYSICIVRTFPWKRHCMCAETGE